MEELGTAFIDMLKDLKKNINIMERELEDMKKNQMGCYELKILHLK